MRGRVCLALLAFSVLALTGSAYGQNYMFEFSLDIGSDTELSDPFMDGDEVFDPGDVYWWQGPMLPGPTNGFKDDFRIFGFDPDPDPMIPSRVPVGSGSAQDYENYFDLDGHDQLDIELLDAQWPHEYMPSNCIYKPDFLQISYDDDQAPGWPANDVPVTAFSPAGMIYGTTGGRDEIIGVNLMPTGVMPPYMIVGIYPIADEITVHQSMFPNPDADDREDDDVDSLDIVPDDGACPHWYFSPDHEAHMGLDPGGIFQVFGGGGFAQVIDEAFHLGIPEETDIDAFEFVWLQDPQEPGPLYLALIYSVDDNDPLTAADESGGMNPNMIYASFMTGYSFPLLMDPLEDDIDGLTVWYESLEEEPLEACCLPDGTCLDVTPADCINNYGGMPMGLGTTCATLPPTILQGPVDVAACENDDVTLSVIVCGAAPLSYQWYKDGTAIAGETNPTLSLLDIRPPDAGSYHVEVTNAFGGPVSSGSAIVTVQVKGDSNCDGVIDNFDIDPFVLALTGGQLAWEALYTCDFLCANDIDRSGVVDNFDIDPFVTCLISPSGYCP